MKPSDFVKYLQRMIALTDTGLTFTKDPFDRERYEDLRSLLSEMLNQGSDPGCRRSSRSLETNFSLCDSLNGRPCLDC